MEKEQKKTREREANWCSAEKEFLRECISVHIDIVEDKGNDASIIQKKNNSWKAIHAAMVSAGYDREIGKLKSQWVRMKMSTRKAVANLKRASVGTGNAVDIAELSEEDILIKSMIIHEFEEDSIVEDSLDNTIEHENNELNSEEEISKEQKTTNFPQKCTVDDKKHSSPSKLQRLRSLLKTASKNRVSLERKRQIAKESVNSELICKLQRKKLSDEIEQQQRMHKLQELQLKEVHSLKLRHLQRQIEQDEELHILKMDLLLKKSA